MAVEKQQQPARTVRIAAALIFYLVCGVAFAVLLSVTLVQHPIFPLQTDSVSWCRSWLLTTVCDYYVAALALCGIIAASEPPIHAILWIFATLVLGGPFCSFYAVYRILRHGGLALR